MPRVIAMPHDMHTMHIPATCTCTYSYMHMCMHMYMHMHMSMCMFCARALLGAPSALLGAPRYPQRSSALLGALGATSAQTTHADA